MPLLESTLEEVPVDWLLRACLLRDTSTRTSTKALNWMAGIRSRIKNIQCNFILSTLLIALYLEVSPVRYNSVQQIHTPREVPYNNKDITLIVSSCNCYWRHTGHSFMVLQKISYHNHISLMLILPRPSSKDMTGPNSTLCWEHTNPTLEENGLWMCL